MILAHGGGRKMASSLGMRVAGEKEYEEVRRLILKVIGNSRGVRNGILRQ